MAKLKTLKPRINVIENKRIKHLNSETMRVSGGTRVKLKRLIYIRDGGHCCMCKRVVGLHDSELDHRMALQFGGDNEESNLWTLCNDCHKEKSSREASTGQPDIEALNAVPNKQSKKDKTVII
jgi:5-methylcytosine-specific restriction enzyme A